MSIVSMFAKINAKATKSEEAPPSSSPSAPAETPASPSAPAETPASPSAPTESPASPSAPAESKTSAPTTTTTDDMEVETSSSSSGSTSSQDRKRKLEDNTEEESAKEELGETKRQKRGPSPSTTTSTSTTREEMTMFVGDRTKPEKEELPTATAVAERYLGTPFDPIEDAEWKAGEPVPYLALARTFEAIEATTKRIEIVDHLCKLLRSVIALTPEDLLMVIYLCTNQVGPSFAGIELGIGDSVIMKAVCQATGRTMKNLKAEYVVEGDLGVIAQESRGTQTTMFKPKPLTVRSVFKTLKEIALIKGTSSMDRKMRLIMKLLVAGVGSEARYLVRSCQGKLRIGLAEASVLAALAHASFLTRPHVPDVLSAVTKPYGPKVLQSEIDEATRIMKEVFCELPWMEKILESLLVTGLATLHDHCYLRPGIPVKPMLAHPSRGVTEIFDRFAGSSFTCEYKYDGERAQIHLLEDGSVHIYSRSSEDNTSKYPDLISMLPTALANPEATTSYVIDCEAVAFDRETGSILPFQILSTRKRKDVAEEDVTVQVALFAFDLLFLNGEPLLKKPFIERRARLRETFAPREGFFMFAHSKDSSDVDEIQEFLAESVKGNCEGLMIKTLEDNATYEPSKRSYRWLKLKSDYVDSTSDSFDLSVIGAYYGKGKRTGVYGGFLLACYDAESETFQSICKIGTGFSDEDLASTHAYLSQHTIPVARSYYAYPDHLAADVWFDAAHTQVWEVRAADLSISPAHKAAIGLVDPAKGISLRFPRFLRIRDDKTPETATSSEQIKDMYLAQDINHGYGGGGGGAGVEEDDFFADEPF